MDTSQPIPSKSHMAESTSPLLTSLLQSPSSIQLNNVSLGDITHTPSNSTTRSTSDMHSSPIVVVDSPKQHFTHHVLATDGNPDSIHTYSGKMAYT